MTFINGYSPYIGTSSAYTGSNTSAKSTKTGTTKSDADVVAQFMAFQKITPEQKIREAILKKLGVSEDQLHRMNPDQLKAMEKKIVEEMKNMIQDKMAQKGMFVDITA